MNVLIIRRFDFDWNPYPWAQVKDGEDEPAGAGKAAEPSAKEAKVTAPQDIHEKKFT